MAEQAPGPLGAGVGEGLGRVNDGLTLLSAVGRGVDGEIGVVVVDAVDCRHRLPGTAGVPAHDVEAIEDLLGEDGGGVPREIGATEARTAGVHEQRTDALVRLEREVTHDGKPDTLGTGCEVVEGRDERGALKTLSTGGPLEDRDVPLRKRGGRTQCGDGPGR